MQDKFRQSSIGQAAGRERQRLLSVIQKKSTRSFLDLCGIKSGMKGIQLHGGDQMPGMVRPQMPGFADALANLDVLLVQNDLIKQDHDASGSATLKPTIEGDYEFVYTNLTLAAFPDPLAALEIIYPMLKSGAQILIECMDFQSQYCTPFNYAFKRYLELFTSVLAKKSAHPSIGPNLRHKLIALGCSHVAGRKVPPIFLAKEMKNLSSLTLESFADALLKEGLTSAAEIQALLFELRSFENEEETMITMPSIFQVRGFKT